MYLHKFNVYYNCFCLCYIEMVKQIFLKPFKVAMC